MTHVALLRGINVGGKRLLPMKELAVLFAAAGCTGVSTYIQSGNVLFTPPAGSGASAELATRLEDRIEEVFGFRPPVVVRTAVQIAGALRDNPFLHAGEPEATLHVMFLAARPDPAAVAKLDADRSPGDRFHVAGGEVYLHLPKGAGNSKLTNAYFDSRLKTIGTVRNWATVSKLLALMQA
jgi:uncharacterized protein (DUF1697 family)